METEMNQELSLGESLTTKHEEFFEIASKKSYRAEYLNAKDKKVSLTFQNTNQYLSGMYELADGLEILGGKTGTTTKAGKCLVMFVKAKNGNIYFAELFGAETLDGLYASMNQLLEVVE